ncbi:uncharacterized protein L203_102107 [Cryptococcus depauperatus CBS 7841]|uniref:Uncharacterized protein n=1 Tax=Cryptococcus depauperatus CBS 7841 TaxID=1295531 RepID=A0A1E3ITB3_9TREE|nr:hypothetical protein L203_01359 [Cryptococcus depauperatus CBS 7841]
MTTLSPIRHTTVGIGTAFERHALSFLTTSMSMSLRRVGGANDGGVDLRGWWYIPRETYGNAERVSSPEDDSRRLRVMVQCKAERKSVGPRAIRELEGVIAQLNYRREQAPTETAIAILISQSGFTRNAMLHATQSNTPLMLLHLPGGQPEDASQPSASTKGDRNLPAANEYHDMTTAESAWWNRALSHKVLNGKIELRREMLAGKDGMMTSVGLWMDGKRVPRYVSNPADISKDL